MKWREGGDRAVRRCPNPECRSTNWKARVGNGFNTAEGPLDPSERYRCCDCDETFRELEESTSDHDGRATHGLAAKLEQLAEEHDGDVPIRGGSA
jgi:transposase-like protein